jgi:hypothetical protein
MNEDNGIVSIHGKDYQTVALRVTKFREMHPDWTLKAKIIGNGEFVTVRATVKDDQGRTISTGHAEEERGAGINKTSAVENCETSAIGRALAFFNYPGIFLRSADEMSDALIQQGIKSVQKDFGERMKIIRGMLNEITDLKDRLADGDFHAAVEIIQELTEDQTTALNLAPTKGGILTTEEISQIKSDDYSRARNELTGHKPKGGE